MQGSLPAPSRGRETAAQFPDVSWRNTLHAVLEVPAIVKLFDVPVGKRILQIGCGTGVAIPPLAKLCLPISLTGIDIAGGMLTDAATRLREESIKAELVLADVERMPFRDQAFDIAIDFGTIYHTGNPDRALAEITRVLDPGGMFVHETALGQMLAHPIRSHRRAISLHTGPLFGPGRTAGFWAALVRL